jgi:hypothetical protein
MESITDKCFNNNIKLFNDLENLYNIRKEIFQAIKKKDNNEKNYLINQYLSLRNNIILFMYINKLYISNDMFKKAYGMVYD